jgi:hypothetical protein
MWSMKAFLTCALAVLTLGAIVATSAQAVEAEWAINETTLSELKLEKEETALAGGPFSILIPSAEATIECKTVGGSGAILKGGKTKLVASLSSCETLKKPACKPTKSIVIEANSELLEVEGNLYDKLSPVGETLATIEFGKECSFGEKVSIKGTVAAEDTLEPEVKQKLVFSEAISGAINKDLEKESKSPLQLTFGKSTAFLSGKIIAELSGGNAGQRAANVAFPKLCDQPLNPCPGPKTYKVGIAVSLEQEVPMKLIAGGLEVKCTEAALGAETASEGGLLRLNVGNAFFAGCSTAMEPSCTVQMTKQPYKWLITRAGARNSGFVENAVFAGIWVTIECDGLTCVYKFDPVTFYLQGGPTATLSAGRVPLTWDSGAGCAITGQWEGEGGTIKYKVVEPSPLYVTP